MKDEKGRSDLIAELAKNTPNIIIEHPDMTKEEFIYEVLERMPESLANVLASAEPEADGKTRRVEIWNGLIVTLQHKKEKAGQGIYKGRTIPEHFKLKTIPHLGMLKQFIKRFSIEVRR